LETLDSAKVYHQLEEGDARCIAFSLMKLRLKQNDLHEVMTVLTHLDRNSIVEALCDWGSHEDGVRTIDAVISVFSEVHGKIFALILE
jgi:hypothetical protein